MRGMMIFTTLAFLLFVASSVDAQSTSGDVFNVNPGSSGGQSTGGDVFNVNPGNSSACTSKVPPGSIILTNEEFAAQHSNYSCGYCNPTHVACTRIVTPSSLRPSVPPNLRNQPPPTDSTPPTNAGPQQSNCPGLMAQARVTASAIEGGNTSPNSMIDLTKAQQACAPGFARPIQCFAMMADAQSKVRNNPNYSRQRALQAQACYESSGSSATRRTNTAPPNLAASPILLKGRVEKIQDSQAAGTDCTPADPAAQKALMGRAVELDRMVTQAEEYSLAGTSRFFEVMSQAVSAKLKALAQAASNPSAATAKAADAIVTYLTSDSNANNEKIYDDMVGAVDLIQKDPAGFSAQFAVDQVANAAAGRLVGCVSKVSTAASAAKKAAAIARATKAAQTLETMQKDADGFGKLVADSSITPSSPHSGNLSKAAPATQPGNGFGANSQPAGANPPANKPNFQTPSAEMVFCEGLPNQCIPTAIAQANTWDTGRPHVATPTGILGPTYPGRSWAEISQVLQKNYGGRKIAGLSKFRQLKQDLGSPFRMPSKQAIINELNDAPDGAQGIVFVRQFAGAQGHAFNVGKFNNQIVWKDMTGRIEATYRANGITIVGGMDPAFLLSGTPAEIWLYRVR